MTEEEDKSIGVSNPKSLSQRKAIKILKKQMMGDILDIVTISTVSPVSQQMSLCQCNKVPVLFWASSLEEADNKL